MRYSSDIRVSKYIQMESYIKWYIVVVARESQKE